MKKLHALMPTLMLLLMALTLSACRANLGNFFDLY